MLLEEMIMIDMLTNGYNPLLKLDVDKYWQERL